MTATTKVPLEELTCMNSSYVDPNGRLFKWNKKLLRALTPEYSEFYIKNLSIFLELEKLGLIVKTRKTNFSIDGYGLVLEHEYLPLVSYCVEWPPEMLKDSAIITLTLARHLTRFNLTLQDASPFNILFLNARPLFVDITSITPCDNSYLWRPYQQFCSFFYYPLFLCSRKRGNIARRLLFNPIQGIEPYEFIKQLSIMDIIAKPKLITNVILPLYIWNIISKYPKLRTNALDKGRAIVNKNLTPAIRSSFFDKVYRDIESTKLLSTSHWSDYYKNSSDYIEEKKNIISDVIEKYRPKSVLDIGCNIGEFSVLAAKKGCNVVSIDSDESVVNALYLRAKVENLSITPLVIDFVNPTPAFGWLSKEFPSAIERIQCDAVFLLALIHHLVFKQRQNFFRIVEALNCFSKKLAVVEFIPKEDKFVQENWEERFAWYTFENLLDELSKFFSIEEIISEINGRKILVCLKKVI